MEREYLHRENNYKLVFKDNTSAKNFIDWLRSTDKEYDAKIHSESISAAIRDKYREQIKALEIQERQQQNYEQQTGQNMNFDNMGLNQYQYNMMNMMMNMGMMPNNGYGNYNQMQQMGQQMKQMNALMGNMAGQMNPNMGMVPGFHPMYHQNNKVNMFVRKAKGENDRSQKKGNYSIN